MSEELVLIDCAHATTEPPSYAADRALQLRLSPEDRAQVVAMAIGWAGGAPDRPEVVLVGTPERLRRLALGIEQFVDELEEGLADEAAALAPGASATGDDSGLTPRRRAV